MGSTVLDVIEVRSKSWRGRARRLGSVLSSYVVQEIVERNKVQWHVPTLWVGIWRLSSGPSF